MDEKWGSWGIIIFLILLFMFFGNGNFFGSRHGNVTTDDVERRNLITAADTNYRIIEQGNATRQVVEATAGATQAKIDFYAYQELRDKLAEEQRKNVVLENQLYNDKKFGAIEAQLATIACKMAKQPELSTLSVAVPSSAIYNPCGCNCGCGGL